MNFTKKYRPRKFSEVVGQNVIVNAVKGLIGGGSAQSLLFYGESGVGKTTMARIVAMRLNCSSKQFVSEEHCGICANCVEVVKSSHGDVLEIDAADTRGIDTIRELKSNLSFAPMFGKYKVLILDEAQGLTKEAQGSLLKVLEKPPENVCIILCSTEPNKILKTVRNRCHSFEFKKVKMSDLLKLLNRICEEEKLKVSTDILKKIAENSKGLPRNAVMKLEQIVSTDMSDEAVSDILNVDHDMPAEILSLCRLLYKRDPDKLWKDVVGEYKKLKNYDPEAIRLSIAGYSRAILEKSDMVLQLQKAAFTLEMFIHPFDGPKPENKLVLTLYNAYKFLKTKK